MRVETTAPHAITALSETTRTGGGVENGAWSGVRSEDRSGPGHAVQFGVARDGLAIEVG